MLTGKQKRYLRSLAVTEKAIFQIGKDGLSNNLFVPIKEALKTRELIKISILKSCDVDIKEAASQLSTQTGSELVQTIGKTVVLYKRNTKEPKIILP